MPIPNAALAPSILLTSIAFHVRLDGTLVNHSPSVFDRANVRLLHTLTKVFKLCSRILCRSIGYAVRLFASHCMVFVAICEEKDNSTGELIYME